MAAKIYHVKPGPDGWDVEILDEPDTENPEDLREPSVVLGGGWIGSEPWIVHRAVMIRNPDGTLSSEYTARRILHKREVPRRRRR